jgi:hypothetical protein
MPRILCVPRGEDFLARSLAQSSPLLRKQKHKYRSHTPQGSIGGVNSISIETWLEADRLHAQTHHSTNAASEWNDPTILVRFLR